jgi:hypothetical protein
MLVVVWYNGNGQFQQQHGEFSNLITRYKMNKLTDIKMPNQFDNRIFPRAKNLAKNKRVRLASLHGTDVNNMKPKHPLLLTKR